MRGNLVGGNTGQAQFNRAYLDGYNEMLRRNAQYKLVDITIPEGITEIPAKGMQYTTCYGGRITLPDTITHLGYRAFMQSDLGAINLPASIVLLHQDGGQLHNCTKLTSVVFDEGYQYPIIPTMMFYGCTALTEIILPECVTTIGQSAFSGCTKLARMTVLATTPPTLASALPENLTAIYVPKGTADAYKAATNWSARADIIAEVS